MCIRKELQILAAQRVPKAGLEFGEACLLGDGTYLRALFFNGFVIWRFWP